MKWSDPDSLSSRGDPEATAGEEQGEDEMMNEFELIWARPA